MLTRRVTIRAPTRKTTTASARPAVSGVKRRRDSQQQQQSSTGGSAAAAAASSSSLATRSSSIKSARGNCKRQKTQQSASSASVAAVASVSSAHVAAAPAAPASVSGPPPLRCSTAAATAAAMAKRAKRKAALAKAQAKREENKKLRTDMQAPDLPAHWSPVVDDVPGNDSLVRLRSDDPTVAAERTAVVSRFLTTINLPQSPQVQSVYRVQQPAVYRAYQRRKAELVAAGGEADIEVFHGPRSTPLHLIHSTSSIGFDPRRGVSLPDHVWFARNANYSHFYSQLVSSAQLPLSCAGYMGSNFLPNPPLGSLHALYAARIAIPSGWIHPYQARGYLTPMTQPPSIYTVTSAAESMPTHLIIYKT